MQSLWKNRVQEMLTFAKRNLKKQQIGKKMINASLKASTELHETYEF